MTLQKAKKILGLNGTENEKEIKKKYRDLIRKAHPDNVSNDLDKNKSVNNNEIYSATEINAAYEYIVKNVIEEDRLTKWDSFNDDTHYHKAHKSWQKRQSKNQTNNQTSALKWNAPINPNAYTDRPIFHYVEDSLGEKIGTIEIDRGKFIWTLEEDFPLFLKSLYETGKRLLQECDEAYAYTGCKENADAYIKRKNSDEYNSDRRYATGKWSYANEGQDVSENRKLEYLAKLTYLLAGQYVDGLVSLEALTTKKDNAYYIKAMLEPDKMLRSIPEGTKLYPAGVVNHKLYLRKSDGLIAGYVSFHDDSLYYAIVPLFEARRVQVKIEVSKWHSKSNTHGAYADIDLWIKLNDTNSTNVDGTTLLIKNLLDEYAK